MSPTTVVRTIQDIMRKDAGVGGDALLDSVNDCLFPSLKDLTSTGLSR